MTLHIARLLNGSQLFSELIYTEYSVTCASIRILARVRDTAGAIAGIFTYHNDTSELDVQVPTRNSLADVHYSNQPTSDPHSGAPIAGSTLNKTLNAPKTTATWNIYRLE
jgi:hypothetical protein